MRCRAVHFPLPHHQDSQLRGGPRDHELVAREGGQPLPQRRKQADHPVLPGQGG
jgi:hypothetical protein